MNQTNKIKKKEERNPTDDDAKYSYIFILSFALPFVAWGSGALLNPKGWASGDPSLVLTLPFFIFSVYPIIFFVVAGFIFLLATAYKKNVLQVLAISFFIISIIYSTFIFMITEAASESEFTG